MKNYEPVLTDVSKFITSALSTNPHIFQSAGTYFIFGGNRKNFQVKYLCRGATNDYCDNRLVGQLFF